MKLHTNAISYENKTTLMVITRIQVFSFFMLIVRLRIMYEYIKPNRAYIKVEVELG